MQRSRTSSEMLGLADSDYVVDDDDFALMRRWPHTQEAVIIGVEEVERPFGIGEIGRWRPLFEEQSA